MATAGQESASFAGGGSHPASASGRPRTDADRRVAAPPPATPSSATTLGRVTGQIQGVESTVLPGLLQTEAYARAVLGGAGLIPPSEIERHLTVRLNRQGVLKRDDPPQFTAVIDEAILRRPVGGRATMREQLLAVVAACAEPHIRVHVVPSAVGAYAGLNGPFVIAHSHDHRVAGYLDNQLQGQVASDPDDIAAMMAAWENVRGEALSHWQSVDLMTEVAETWS
ncbi:DUF5753 domain-containing protein [Micromonospora sp. NPDC005254]|uniref:DUF5753 domain-containing protein n=1 Tax=Micromonospora sp. NPDC005254 TaxID=3364229 RepID=UPI0036A5C51C